MKISYKKISTFIFALAFFCSLLVMDIILRMV